MTQGLQRLSPSWSKVDLEGTHGGHMRGQGVSKPVSLLHGPVLAAFHQLAPCLSVGGMGVLRTGSKQGPEGGFWTDLEEEEPSQHGVNSSAQALSAQGPAVCSHVM